MPAKRRYAVIPAYNEEKLIGSVVAQTKRHVDCVIVVNDCSTDLTTEAAKKEGALIVTNSENLGYSGSLDRGVTYAISLGADQIITLDADGQLDPSYIPSFFEHLDNYDLVVGVRPRTQRISEKIFSYAAHVFGITDPLCGLKAFNRDVFDSLGYYDRISSVNTQLLFYATAKKMKIKQIPIEMQKRKGNAKFGSGIKPNLKIFFAMVRVMFFYFSIKLQKTK